MKILILTYVPASDAVKVGDIIERRAWASDTEFKAFLQVWRCKKGIIQDVSHAGIEVVKVVAKRDLYSTFAG